jgi:DUF971 family protein
MRDQTDVELDRPLDPLREIRVNASARALELEWSDGSSAALPFATLRDRCMCAECRTARRQGLAIAVADDIAITDAVAYGPNAVQLVFNDGHARGIFPFSYLRELGSRGAITSGQP